MVRSVSRLSSIAMLLVMVIAPMISTSASAQAIDCSNYDAWIWAQAVYDRDPDANAQLDPDGNGVACDQLAVGGFAPVVWADGIPADAQPAKLVSVADGDTITVQMPGGANESVRLLHIDTPETGGTIGQCGGTESTDYLSWILSYAKDQTVYLDHDVTGRDRYDRMLAYVWFEVEGDPNPYMANDAMVLAGWAESETFEPDVKYKDQLNTSEQFSVDHVTGVRLLCGKFGRPANDAGPSDAQIKQAWNKQPNQGQLPAFPSSGVTRSTRNANESIEQPAAAPVNQAVAAPAAVAPAATGNCDPSYPGVCIPPYSQVGDLDCGDVSYRRFTVIPPDSHGFDGDFDGVGCEGG